MHTNRNKKFVDEVEKVKQRMKGKAYGLLNRVYEEQVNDVVYGGFMRDVVEWVQSLGYNSI